MNNRRRCLELFVLTFILVHKRWKALGADAVDTYCKAWTYMI